MSGVVTTLPRRLVAKYRESRASGFSAKRFARLAKTQKPDAMVIACADSRVDPAKIFGVPAGSFFTIRNIANLVPRRWGDKAQGDSVAAALEYAVLVLKVRHIMVIGHSNCGGIHHGYHLHEKKGRHKLPPAIRNWLKILKPAYKRLPAKNSHAKRIKVLEKLSVLMSIRNMQRYPFIADAAAKGRLKVHGLWHDIPSGVMYCYNPETREFEPLT